MNFLHINEKFKSRINTTENFQLECGAGTKTSLMTFANFKIKVILYFTHKIRRLMQQYVNRVHIQKASSNTHLPRNRFFISQLLTTKRMHQFRQKQSDWPVLLVSSSTT